MPEGKRPSGYLLDRPFYNSGDYPPALSKGIAAVNDCRADELLFRFLFQPLRAETDRNAAIGVPE